MKASTHEASLDAAVSAAEQIPGWMTPEELAWLATAAHGLDRVIEVGSWQGRSAKAMAGVLGRGGKLTSVDDLVGEDSDPLPVPELDRLFHEHLAEEITAGKVEVVRAPSPEAAWDFPAGYADLIFIDGNHIYPAPLRDIEAWSPVLKEGGVLCGHDSYLDGVAISLREAFPDQGIEKAAGSIWVAPR